MSGHSKWATIKHKKGAADKARGKLFAKLARQIEVSAKSGGDVDIGNTAPGYRGGALPFGMRRDGDGNLVADEDLPVAEIIRDPVVVVTSEQDAGVHPAPIPRPPFIFGPGRRNSEGLALEERHVRDALLASMGETLRDAFAIGPLVAGKPMEAGGPKRELLCPHDRRRSLGTVVEATPALADEAAAPLQAVELAACEAMERAGTVPEGTAAAVREKAVIDADRIDEVMSFIDFLRAFDRARRLSTTSGEIDESGLGTILEMFVNTAPSGTVVLSRGDEEGKIVFSENEILSCNLGIVSAPFLAGLLAASLGWRSTYLILGLALVRWFDTWAGQEAPGPDLNGLDVAAAKAAGSWPVYSWC